MRDESWLSLMVVFVPFSLAAFGGGHSVIAGIQQTVVGSGWLTPQEFSHVFAASRVAPGPGSMLVTLVGWHIAGWSGAALATLAFFLPSSLLCLGVDHFTRRHRQARWLRLLEEALAPIGAGLVLAGVVTILHTVDAGFLGWVMAPLVAVAITRWPRLHPLAVMAMAAMLFTVVTIAAPLLRTFLL